MRTTMQRVRKLTEGYISLAGSLPAPWDIARSSPCNSVRAMATVTVTARRAALATAAERRLPVNKPASAGILYKNHDEEHPRRQELRKMIDKGILERNSLEISLRALETMKRIADNIVKYPDQDTYKKIKRSNQVFMRAVVEPKGALEFFAEASDQSPNLNADDSGAADRYRFRYSDGLPREGFDAQN
ncbi:hypothetical protein DAEQUDRAFT_112866 [Daedalea quercina L-15889]|uniref:PUB domain-containing protein n=1 Tax=Daedalea quercina L-15889 TaxID=1314783 RepID=A0A165S5X2_9APHY|nr:hypothetical protein DAEQUDRAFT_112866 [Daedalea quercina L-15889]